VFGTEQNQFVEQNQLVGARIYKLILFCTNTKRVFDNFAPGYYWLIGVTEVSDLPLYIIRLVSRKKVLVVLRLHAFLHVGRPSYHSTDTVKALRELTIENSNEKCL